MCSRYYSDLTAWQAALTVFRPEASDLPPEGDIHPGDWSRLLFLGQGPTVRAVSMRWGFPSSGAKGVLINARAEGIGESPLFLPALQHGRCVAVARGFYEWDQMKNKVNFRRRDGKYLYLAGVCREYEDGIHYVLLTTKANRSVAPIHTRMPLILEEEQVFRWLHCDRQVTDLLEQIPAELAVEEGFYQQTFNFT